ncbi:alpha/beta hydrolase [Cesiribacter sp. SM1]|uniref:alpha/beta hydrolase n=1 Tax=Cesiribacter sp. SM1 TaxID=2861196 RepID=UPI001CD3BF1A|nr:alpha/beta hydrolase [Cesiribacter sp. SM1]
MNQHSLRFEYEARYSTLGEPGNKAWLVCHGYGQLAPYFIRHFGALAELGYYIVAPEGLSRFYIQGHSGRVGASWMTREERLTDISNYLHYLDAVAEHSGLREAAEINLLGFSQGVATISRWAMHTQLQYKKLVLWAGVFPPDLPPQLSSSRLGQVSLYQVWGAQDPFLKREETAKQTLFLQSLNPLKYSELSFEGEHSMHSPTLLKVASD